MAGWLSPLAQFHWSSKICWFWSIMWFSLFLFPHNLADKLLLAKLIDYFFQLAVNGHDVLIYLCFCYPGGRRRSEPDEAELLKVSKRLVEDAVNRALQQYKQETLQNGGGPNAAAVKPPGNTEETATKTNTTANSITVNRKWPHPTEAQRLKNQQSGHHQPGLVRHEKSQ